MADCIPLSREMLKDPIDIGVSDEPLDFARARAIAEAARPGGGPRAHAPGLV